MQTRTPQPLGAVSHRRPVADAISPPRSGPPEQVGVLARSDCDVTAVLATVGRWARGRGITAVALEHPGIRLPPGIERPAVDALARTELLIAVGGDGTVLRALHLGAARGTPVLPVHLGRLGYLADVEIAQLDSALDAIADGEHTVEEHGALRVTGGPADSIALNEVVLRRLSGGSPAMIALRIDGDVFMRYSCDGVIVATAMGSTAYSFSAGGPIVSSAVAATVVTPLAPHAPASRPLVLSEREVVDIDVLPASVGLSVEIDGRDRGEVGPGDRLHIAPSRLSGRLIRIGHVGSAARARSKLQISDSPELTATSRRVGRRR
jgi:NAD+ kinase